MVLKDALNSASLAYSPIKTMWQRTSLKQHMASQTDVVPPSWKIFQLFPLSFRLHNVVCNPIKPDISKQKLSPYLKQHWNSNREDQIGRINCFSASPQSLS